MSSPEENSSKVKDTNGIQNPEAKLGNYLVPQAVPQWNSCQDSRELSQRQHSSILNMRLQILYLQ